MTISKKRTTNVSHGGRHFHQLFRQLRLENRTMRDGIQWDLGHCDDLLRNGSVEELEDVHQLVHYQRHRSVEIEHWHWHEGLDHLLRGVPLDPLLRPPRLDQTGRPRTPHGVFLIEQREERRVPGHTSLRRVSLEEQKAQKQDRFLRGRQIAYLIYEYFRVTGANDSVANYDDLFTIGLRNDDIQEIRLKVGRNIIVQ